MDLAYYKRFREYMVADREFEKDFYLAPEATLKKYNLDLDKQIQQLMWDKAYGPLSEHRDHPLSKIEEEFTSMLQDNILVNNLKNELITNPNYRAWRQRQIERTKSQFRKIRHDKLLHLPFAFELTKGCSGQCPFCALAPTPLEDIFYYTDENAILWREILQITKDILGKGAGASICYWATEPFDNPDYEKFCLDFVAVHGAFPCTTTVKHMENLHRTRNFLKLSEKYGRKRHHFSITSLPMLKKLYQEFTPEELSMIELSLNNKESKAPYVNSGRAKNLYHKAITKEKFCNEETITCVSGFLVNMIERTIKLITPCKSSEKWPLGYMIYHEASFTTSHDFKSCITEMIEKYMPLFPGVHDIIAFRSDLQFQTVEDGFKVSTRFMRRVFRNDPLLRTLGQMIANGKHTLGEIENMFELYCLPPTYIPDAIQKMFDSGLLQESHYTA